jgi:hypothetical protein
MRQLMAEWANTPTQREQRWHLVVEKIVTAWRLKALLADGL